MEQQRHRSGGGRRRKRRQKASTDRAPVEPILIAARRPNSPLVARAPAAISATPKPPRTADPKQKPENGKASREPEPTPRRTARIVQVTRSDADEQERQRLRLLDRLMAAETRGAITRAADEYLQAGFAFPEEQAVQLQLLEHFDEDRARTAVETLARLIATSDQPPLKRPVLEQRLRRLEEYGEDGEIREAAAELRRAIRV